MSICKKNTNSQRLQNPRVTKLFEIIRKMNEKLKVFNKEEQQENKKSSMDKKSRNLSTNFFNSLHSWFLQP